MMANLPAREKQAFFGLLDEYFASRPHRLPASSTGLSASANQAGLADRTTSAAGAAAGAAVTSAMRDQFARTAISARGPPPPTPSASSKPKPGTNVPAGLVTTKKLGSFHLASRSIPSDQPPQSPPAATTTTTMRASATGARTLPPLSTTGASVPTFVPPPAAPAEAALPEGVIATAQVLYDYGDGTDADDLQATEGEQIYLTERISDDWWRALSQDQARQGIIPTTYVRQL